MKERTDRELKFTAGPNFRLPDMPGEPLPPRAYTRTYYDTADHNLANVGITLHRQIEGGKRCWFLRFSQGPGCQQFESRGGPLGPPEVVQRLLFAHLRGKGLVEVAKLRTRQTGYRVREIEGPLADVTVDSVSVLDGRRVQDHFSTLQVTPKRKNHKALHRITMALRSAGAEDVDARLRVFKTLRSSAPETPHPVSSEYPAVTHLKAMLRGQVKAILAHDPGTRLGTDPEDLHQMRVATRRSRAYLRAVRPMLEPEWTKALRSELAWLGTALGPVRDLDVLLDHLEAEATILTSSERRKFDRLLSSLRNQRDTARAAMLDTLHSEQYLKLLDRLTVAAESPHVQTPNASFVDFAAREFKKLRKAMHRFSPDVSDKALHRIRIRTKRARYAAELAEASIGKPATRFIRQAKALQDILGTHQDAIVAEEWLRRVMRRTRGVWIAFTAGRIAERLRKQRAEARATLIKAWKKLDRRGNKAWLRPAQHQLAAFSSEVHGLQHQPGSGVADESSSAAPE